MNSLITLRWRNNRITVNTDDIIYIESYNRHLSVNTIRGKTEIVDKLCDFFELLPQEDYLIIHKSFAVNMNYIKELGSSCAVMANGDVLPVSVRRKTQALKLFDEYCKKRGAG